MKNLHAFSPAKINLTLDVIPRQNNETFHKIHTIFHKISLTDEIEIMEAPFFSIEGFKIPIQENLIYQGFELIHTFFPKEKLPSVKVKIKKNIPTGGGLGGGSSNFATFIKLYLEYFELGETPQRLLENSGNYGKDIPFFLTKSNCALGENFGEVITPLNFNFKNKKILLYQPDFKNATTKMYTHLTNYGTNFTEKFIQKPDLKNCGNAFDEFFMNEQYQAISKNFNGYTMTGSGSCFFSFEPKEIKGCESIELELI